MREAKNYVFLALANLFWAGNFIAGGLIADSVSPLLLTTIRWTLATIPLFVLAALIEKPDWRVAFGEWKKHVLLSLLGLVGYAMFTYTALHHTSSLNASLFNSLCPALIAAIAVLLARERLRPIAILGLSVSLLGVCLVLFDAGSAGVSFSFGLGELCMVGAVAVWCAYTILGRRIRSSPIAATAVQALIASVLLVPVALLSGEQLPSASPAWWGILYVVLFPSVLSYLMWNLAVRNIGAARSGVYLNLMPLFVALIGLAIGQPISPVQIAGGILIVAGVITTSKLAAVPAQPPAKP